MTDSRLETERLIIRNWEDRDRDLFHLINSDEKVMEFFPFRRDRKFTDKKLEEIRKLNAKRGYGFMALELKANNQCIGMAGLQNAHQGNGLPENTIEIGWRLAPDHWGKGYVSEAAHSLLHFGFDKLDLPEIVSFAAERNKRSIAVMERIGMTRDPNRDFNSSRVPDNFPHLRHHVFYYMKNPIKKGV